MVEDFYNPMMAGVKNEMWAEGLTMREFRAVWENLAEEGKADTYGASQCRRCKVDWRAAGKPNPETWVPAWLAQDDARGAGP